MKSILFTFFFLPMSFAAADTKRVISLSPAITEIVFALDLQKQLVGVSEFSDFPEAAKKITAVGPYSKPNLEKIVSLKPNLVLLPAEGPEDIAVRLKNLKINFQVVTIKKLSQIGDSAVEISKALDKPDAGIKFKKTWDQKIEETFKNTTQNLQQTIIVIQTEPIIVAASNTFLDEIVKRCGGDNVFSSLEGYPKVALEAVLNKNPQKILIIEHFGNVEDKVKSQNFWSKINPAVSIIDPDTATRPGPRILEATKKICSHINNEPTELKAQVKKDSDAK